jgi:hypothetical protein
MHLHFPRSVLMEPDLCAYISVVSRKPWVYTEVGFTVQAQTCANSFPSREPHALPEGRFFSRTVPHVSTYKAGHWLPYGWGGQRMMLPQANFQQF